MTVVLLTAFGIGGATILGTLLGFFYRHFPHRLNCLLLSFSAGIMLSAAILGLILPSLGDITVCDILITILGIFTGAFCISLIERALPWLSRTFLDDAQPIKKDTILFFLAMAVHNFPEGLAAGVSFGYGNQQTALLIAGGIAFQNIPEGLVTVMPLLASGIPPLKALGMGAFTGIIEIIGTVIGFLSVNTVQQILPFALSFAGGTMLYIVCDEMIPQAHESCNHQQSTYAMLLGFTFMFVSDILLT